ncbi:cysteine hydrolase family protein [Jongsikchunia kroppenstedtii]|uniref:cysteine hydrolase family protein n=1 Tax=Jongsikchunia kroppenstedtii TaxID=1121721 RepID=UPI000378A20A|nr:isochorismatase family cysteine hydrolase [Jongsikchunia kroppenstedtii]
MTVDPTLPDYLAPDWERSALVLIDVQNDFVDGATPVPGTADKIDAMAHLAERFRTHGRPVVHIVRLYPPGGSDVDPPRRAAVEAGDHVVAPGSPGSQIPARLLPAGIAIDLDTGTLLTGAAQPIGADEFVLFKPRWSAFHRTRLHDLLQQRNITTVVVAGCNLPNCPRATLFDASERDYRTVLVTDATSQTNDSRLHDLALIGVQLRTTAEVFGD